MSIGDPTFVDAAWWGRLVEKAVGAHRLFESQVRGWRLVAWLYNPECWSARLPDCDAWDGIEIIVIAYQMSDRVSLQKRDDHRVVC